MMDGLGGRDEMIMYVIHELVKLDGKRNRTASCSTFDNHILANREQIQNEPMLQSPTS